MDGSTYIRKATDTHALKICNTETRKMLLKMLLEPVAQAGLATAVTLCCQTMLSALMHEHVTHNVGALP